MLNWMRNRFFVLAAILMLAVALTGCGGAKDTASAAPAAPAAVEPAKCPECPPPVDKAVVLKEATAQYFNTLPSTSNMIDAAELKKKVDAKDATIFLLDIRSAADFAAGHVEGFTNIPFATVGKNLDKLPKDKQIFVTCYSGQTSGQTVAALRIAGYNATSIKGGFPSVEKAGFEIKK